ncbi:diguanylate cyclase [Clostridium sp. C2-6-12]|uniref:sensor domain-containing diguanylate cyclase n=1 Tax=Clostridium sp. C2-6-12 TaxID=2698832 RepID=UPI00136A102D|nr:diguanylate cyclase [Clostridium sp. C2-6-12]
MKQYGIVYTNFEEMNSFIKKQNINNNENILIQVFTSTVKIEFINKLIKEIVALLPNAEIIGTSTAGEIFLGNAFDNTTVISFTVFEEVQVKAKLFNGNKEYEVGVEISKELIEEDTKVIILFSNGLLVNSWEVIQGIGLENHNVIICGGQAGDNGYLKETLVFTKEGVTKSGIAVASLTGKNLIVTTELNFSWSPIGKIMTVTKAVKNRIFTIDNVKAIEIYRKYLGDEVADELPMSATEFPLIIKKSDIDIARVAFRCYKDGSLGFLGNVEIGDKIQFGYGNVGMLKECGLKIADRLNENKSIEAIFVYSCSVRKSFMKDSIKVETCNLNDIAPTFGFFTYGEFFTYNNSYKMLNVTMTILGLSEGKETIHKNKTSLLKSKNQNHSFFEGKDLGVINVFTNLVNQVTKELQESNEILEKQKSTIEKMSDFTKSIMEINTKMLTSCETDSIFTLILDKVLDIIPKGKMGSIIVMQNNKLQYKATKGYISNETEKINLDIPDILEVYKDNIFNSENIFKPVILKNLEENLFDSQEHYEIWRKILLESPYEILTSGIGIDGRSVGFINLFNNNEAESFDEEDKKLLQHLCYDIAIAFNNAELLENIIYMSRYDKLTGVYNRRYFETLLNKALNEANNFSQEFVICTLDLNDFKEINDVYGHDSGDKVLVQFAKIFKSELSKEDIFGRVGGDEFSIIFRNKDRRQVKNIINRIYMAFENSVIHLNDDIKKISFAYGISQFPDDSIDAEELLKIADKSMYDEKRRMKSLKF